MKKQVEEIKENTKEIKRQGKTCSSQSLAEYNQTWKDIDDCLKNLNSASN